MVEKTKMELEAENKKLREDVISYQGYWRDEMQKTKELTIKLRELSGFGNDNLEKMSIPINNYSFEEVGLKYGNILSHMDILFCSKNTRENWDCAVCKRYIDILISAFEACNVLCSRDVSDDFSTKDITNDIEKEVAKSYIMTKNGRKDR
jgi:hypothetical protein